MCEFLLINNEKCNSLYLAYSGLMSSQIKLWRLRAVFSCGLMCIFGSSNALEKTPQTLQYTVFHTLPHNPDHYTQGLVIDDGKLFESTGGYGFSALYEKDLESGKTLKMRKLAQNIFGEGVAVLKKNLYQLSWRNRTGFVYDRALQPLRAFKYDTEGWGLTSDGAQLIMSDGSAQLYWLDAKTQAVTRQITVRNGARALSQLNELEYVDGLIYANVWMTDLIAVIDPASGNLRAWIDLSALKKGFTRPKTWNEREHVLNGIAYDTRSGHFFVTGKCWPAMFEIVIEKPPRQ